MKFVVAAITFALISSVATAQESATDDGSASHDEVQRVIASISRIGCTAGVIEKDDDDQFEVDDATCDIGQYDIDLDGDYEIESIERN